VVYVLAICKGIIAHKKAKQAEVCFVVLSARSYFSLVSILSHTLLACDLPSIAQTIFKIHILSLKLIIIIYC
jgi:hypothetical protein